MMLKLRRRYKIVSKAGHQRGCGKMSPRNNIPADKAGDLLGTTKLWSVRLAVCPDIFSH